MFTPGYELFGSRARRRIHVEENIIDLSYGAYQNYLNKEMRNGCSICIPLSKYPFVQNFISFCYGLDSYEVWKVKKENEHGEMRAARARRYSRTAQAAVAPELIVAEEVATNVPGVAIVYEGMRLGIDF